MSGYALLNAVIVPSASVAWAQLYQMTSPSFFAAGTILLFHSAIAAWYLAGDAVVSTGAAAGGLLCARTGAGTRPTTQARTTRIPGTSTAPRGPVISRSLRSRPRSAATRGPLAATRRASRARRAAGVRPPDRSLSR